MSQELQDEHFMALAIQQAKKADALNEVPVGAVVVLDGEVIGEGYNQPISGCDPTAHAEVMALRQAAKNVSNYRLVNADLYVTIEPCTMCAGAIVHSRIRRLVYGATEPKAGVIESQQTILTQSYFNHRVEVVSGILLDQCTDIVQAFFRRRRAEKKQAKRTKNG
ncbi:tRNA adenosine(34) deaminase TadA [Bermanella marisrubri]|uniref:tRNA-specific adenosine deaminase n=1 Tax=Bermanella marisrubri TaxID=207949 RepID=Q1N053_9GAMM|nr:tRNA adenosine(34) deaminase TadA [Bermanella marisrubri]EAT11664.1 cytidine/deoxycytidylate deaminase family protein [Oceanobacter sp. RED65] [Bermanella marisrubri]QIZ83299.1 tRNA adenosine(34) deaminase TadA [Bermanella marisrubri]